MRYFVLIAVFLFTTSVFGQALAKATYASNGKMIGIADLTGLQDCRIENGTGKVSKAKISDSSASITLKTETGKAEFTVPLGTVKPDDKAVLFKHLITKGNTLRVGAYRCSDGSPASVFSVDRVY